MPDITTTFDTAVLLIIICNFDTIENSLRSGNLVWTHDHQHILRCKNTILRKNIQNRMLCEKSLCKINQIRNHTIICICPEACKLKTVTGLCLTCSLLLMFLFRISSGTVGIILCVCTIGNDKNLNVLIQPTPCPERVPLIAINLIECLTDGHASAFQFNMNKRQTIYQYCNIIAVVMLRTTLCANHILIDDLQPVIMDILFIYERNILGLTIITL